MCDQSWRRGRRRSQPLIHPPIPPILLHQNPASPARYIIPSTVLSCTSKTRILDDLPDAIERDRGHILYTVFLPTGRMSLMIRRFPDTNVDVDVDVAQRQVEKITPLRSSINPRQAHVGCEFHVRVSNGKARPTGRARDTRCPPSRVEPSRVESGERVRSGSEDP